MTASPWQYFTMEELTCKCGCGRMEMTDDYMRKLVAMRRTLGFPFPVSSAYRCPEYNNKVSSTGLIGPHTTGQAADITLRGTRAFKFLQLAAEYGMTGIGVNQKGDKRFIHTDDLPNAPGQPRPWVWSY